ncbi:class I SAM-dependent methyltransferase [Gluconacetobacter aggeris]|uniref:Class I SAM-dependent methyltransferase n=1 Tax=Gluconacetobacter aggeris TaxID=1286186 RepID=A0A7W4ITQ4_9PROT|nr:class I SAM-dependent methyltransferase [Gluconacetobacter aggeris]MBB2168955.1 class I SAM-dependent methyltransferase [Gluconacetobacter aggeris]
MTTIEQIDRRFPSDHSRQVDAEYYIHELATSDHIDFMDLGAGDGRSYDVASQAFPDLAWVGVDIADSPEVVSRTRTDCNFRTFDGINLPFSNNSFDVVYSRQVFEHVRYPEALLREVARVLRPGGFFIGSVSQMEPFHSNSLWNFTYYGFAVLADSAGLSLSEFRPGIDGITLTTRHFALFGLAQDMRGIFASMFSADSPINVLIGNIFSGRRCSVSEVNRTKTTYCGHLCFQFRKPVHGVF